MATGKPQIPAEVVKAVTERWPELASAWLERAPDEFAQISHRYRGSYVRTFNARYGFVVEVETANGSLVLKSTPDPDGMDQAEVARSLSRIGVSPHIHEIVRTPVSVWTVASRIFPGDPVGRGTVSLDCLASIFRKMRDQKAEQGDLPSLADWLRSRLDDDNLSDLSPGRSQASQSERRRAIAILEDLRSGVHGMVCHGDASSRNILRGPDEQLMLIDPRGVTGDVCYDVAVAAWKTTNEEPSRDRAAKLARLVGVDTERVHAWLTVADVARV